MEFLKEWYCNGAMRVQIYIYLFEGKYPLIVYPNYYFLIFISAVATMTLGMQENMNLASLYFLK